MLNEVIQLKCEAEEKRTIYRQEKESEIEKLKEQLGKNMAEMEDFTQTLESEDKQVMLLRAEGVK